MQPTRMTAELSQVDVNAALATKRCPVVLLLGVFLVRLVVAFAMWQIGGSDAFISPDTITYTEPSQTLLHGSFSRFGAAEIFRTPGYPLLLAPAVASGHLVGIALLENLLLATVSAYLIWLIAIKLLPASNAGFGAVILYCFEPLSIVYSEKVLSEALFTTLLLLTILCWLRFLNNPTYGALAQSAIGLAASAYVRPVVLYLGIFVLPLLLLGWPSGKWSLRVGRALCFLLTFSLILAPWVIRNAAVADYKGFSSSADWNLYFLSAAAVQSKLEHRTLAEVQEEWGNLDPEQYFRSHPEQRAWSQGRIARFWGGDAKRIIRGHLLLYAAIHARGCAIVLFDPGVTDILKVFRLYPESGGLLSRALDQGFARSILWLVKQYPVAAIALLLLGCQLLLYYVLALAGLRRLPSAVSLLFVTIVLYFVVVSGVPAAVARYRVPFMPIVCICAGIGIACWTSGEPGSKPAEA